MTPQRLSEIGKTLFGFSWQQPMALSLANGHRTIRKWAKGKEPIPASVAGELAALCEKRAADLIAAAKELKSNPNGENR